MSCYINKWGPTTSSRHYKMISSKHGLVDMASTVSLINIRIFMIVSHGFLLGLFFLCRKARRYFCSDKKNHLVLNVLLRAWSWVVGFVLCVCLLVFLCLCLVSVKFFLLLLLLLDYEFFSSKSLLPLLVANVFIISLPALSIQDRGIWLCILCTWLRLFCILIVDNITVYLLMNLGRICLTLFLQKWRKDFWSPSIFCDLVQHKISYEKQLIFLWFKKCGRRITFSQTLYKHTQIKIKKSYWDFFFFSNTLITLLHGAYMNNVQIILLLWGEVKI